MPIHLDCNATTPLDPAPGTPAAEEIDLLAKTMTELRAQSAQPTPLVMGDCIQRLGRERARVLRAALIIAKG